MTGPKRYRASTIRRPALPPASPRRTGAVDDGPDQPYPGAEPAVRLGSVNSGSVQARDNLPDLRRRVLAAEGRPRNEMFTHREPADDDGLEADFPNEIRRDCKGVLVIARDRHPDRFARAMRILG